MTHPLDTNADGAGQTASLTDRVRSLRLPERRGPGGRGRLPWVLCVVLLLTTVAFGYQAFRGPRADAARPDAKAKPGTLDPTATSGDVVLESKGYIIPVHQIQVSPKISGMLTDLYIEEGQYVEEGDVLAVLETVDYQADVARAQATLVHSRNHLQELARNQPLEVKQTAADLAEAEAQLRQLKPEFERTRRLTLSGAGAMSDFEKAESAYVAMERRIERLRIALDLMKTGPRVDQIEQAKAEVRQSEADLVKAQWRLDNCKILAPVSGTILTKKAEKGNIVNPIAFNVSASVCDMADLSQLEVDLNIQERDIAQVFQGQECRIVAEAFPNRKPYEGYVSRLMPTADRAKGAIPVRVKVKIPADERLPHLKANVGGMLGSAALLPLDLMPTLNLVRQDSVYLKPDMSVIVSFKRGPAAEGEVAK